MTEPKPTITSHGEGHGHTLTPEGRAQATKVLGAVLGHVAVHEQLKTHIDAAIAAQRTHASPLGMPEDGPIRSSHGTRGGVITGSLNKDHRPLPLPHDDHATPLDRARQAVAGALSQHGVSGGDQITASHGSSCATTVIGNKVTQKGNCR